ncbi:helix-turn-helix transcriptional regulator [Paenibacillus sp. VCA1]|uniref:helix-turn-helix transcriptional regulator n=1 Tax=Paenibacillus sp. VCA1 TaxID=3039148 RepID=UPI002872604D|nr:helix-turn-helix transcriptional regulator [Paenibacillus sp. VCA1]MDR9855573.1 helix-turn-helix transcriptional regulator [Paenibacillus sp. VCA1]
MNDEQKRQEIGQFLRSRRLRLTPQSAGLQHADFTRRRTKGLRREEVAALAGISLPWYTSLEQGRDINVSDEVLDSLARVLRLNGDERKHLYLLARPPRTASNQDSDQPIVSDSLKYLLDQMPSCPAYISDSKMNVLAWNPLASSVFGSFGTADSRECNMIWRMYMLPSYRTMFIGWEDLAGSLLGHFRAMYTRHIEDPWYTEFIEEMSEGSAEFAARWGNYEVGCISQLPRVIVHPRAGLLNLSTHLFPVHDSSCQFLNVFTPDLQDGSVERLATLAEESKSKQTVTI